MTRSTCYCGVRERPETFETVLHACGYTTDIHSPYACMPDVPIQWSTALRMGQSTLQYAPRLFALHIVSRVAAQELCAAGLFTRHGDSDDTYCLTVRGAMLAGFSEAQARQRVAHALEMEAGAIVAKARRMSDRLLDRAQTILQEGL